MSIKSFFLLALSREMVLSARKRPFSYVWEKSFLANSLPYCFFLASIFYIKNMLFSVFLIKYAMVGLGQILLFVNCMRASLSLQQDIFEVFI